MHPAPDPPLTEPSPAATPEKRGPNCLAIDLEVGRESGRIHQLAGLRGDSGASLVFPTGKLPQALETLDELANGAAFLLGHNLIAFDLPRGLGPAKGSLFTFDVANGGPAESG